MRKMEWFLLLALVVSGSTAMAQMAPAQQQQDAALLTALLDGLSGPLFRIVAFLIFFSGMAATIMTQSFRHTLLALPISAFVSFGPSFIKSLLDPNSPAAANEGAATQVAASDGSGVAWLVAAVFLAVCVIGYAFFRRISSTPAFSEDQLREFEDMVYRSSNASRRPTSTIPPIGELPPPPTEFSSELREEARRRLSDTPAKPISTGEAEQEVVVRNKRKIVL